MITAVDLMRHGPRTLGEFIGQDHLLRHESLIANYVQLGYLPSMILYGPPGSGKTTLARLLATELGYLLVEFSGTDATLAQLKKTIVEIQMKNVKRKDPIRVVIFIDEFHRFTVKQQDFLLGYIESGNFVFIGATSINLKSRIRRAIISRCQVFELKALSVDEMAQILANCITNCMATENGVPQYSSECLNLIASHSNGDIRIATNLLNLCNIYFGSRDEIDYNELHRMLESSLLVTPGSVPRNNSGVYSDLFTSLQANYNYNLDLNHNGTTRQTVVEMEKYDFVDYTDVNDRFVDFLKQKKVSLLQPNPTEFHQIQVSDDSDVELDTDGPAPVPWDKLTPVMFAKYRAMFHVEKLLQNGESPFDIAKQLVVFVSEHNMCHKLVTKLVRYVKSMRTVDDPASILHMCVDCIITSARHSTPAKSGRPSTPITFQIDEVKRYLVPENISVPEPTISYDGALLQMVANPPQEIRHSGNLPVPVEPFDEAEDYNIGLE
jgi:Holliday junction resolvasome RuvABC ATP-dependent DNA helicase subunit